jgi:glucose-1-phosphate thymidylyltransferase
MKGVVLAGGLGAELYPLTFATNKHLLPVYDKPMVFYPLETLVRAGIKDILLVVGGPHAGHFIRVLKNGKKLGIKHLEYAFQETEGGIADALSLAEEFANHQPIAVILGDNTTEANISQEVKNFKEGCLIFIKKVPDLHRFGVPVFAEKDSRKIIRIEEKPRQPKSPFAVTGFYLYDSQVFPYIKKCRPSSRGRLEITDVNNFYIKNGQLNWVLLKDFWSDAGTFESLFRTSTYWAEKKLK